jgi:hypothetical protein
MQELKDRVAGALAVPKDPMSRELYLSTVGNAAVVVLFVLQLLAALATVCINTQSLLNFSLMALVIVCASLLFFLRK